AGRKNWLRTRWNRANLCANLLERLRESLGCEKCRFDPMLLTLDSNAFWVTKSTKDTRSARREIIVRDLVWERFSCAFSSSCSTNTFQVRKATKVFIQIGFLCGYSCLLRALRDPRRAFLIAPNCSLTKGQEN